MFYFYGVILSFLLLATWNPSSATAAESSWSEKGHLRIRLLAADIRQAGLELEPLPGWHFYWRTPGEGGLAPALKWDASENLSDVHVSWPAPQRFQDLDMYSFGYDHPVILPLTITPQDPAAPVTLVLDASIMVCNGICIPQDFEISLSMAPSGDDEAAKKILEQAREKLPQTDETLERGLKIESAVIGPKALVVRAFSQFGFDEADLFAESSAVMFAAPPYINPDEKDKRYAFLSLERPSSVDDLTQLLANARIVLTLKAGGRAIEKTIDFGNQDPVTP